MKYYNINWVAGKWYVVREGKGWLKKAYLTTINERTLEFVFQGNEAGRILFKSDFGLLGDWEMVEPL